MSKDTLGGICGLLLGSLLVLGGLALEKKYWTPDEAEVKYHCVLVEN